MILTPLVTNSLDKIAEEKIKDLKEIEKTSKDSRTIGLSIKFNRIYINPKYFKELYNYMKIEGGLQQ